MGNISFSGRGGALDAGLAGFAACAFAFAAFALPEWRLAQAVGATGLSDILAAAQPPFGLKARLAVAAVAALLAFAASYGLLRFADRRPARSRGATDADAAPEPIRLRRADAHPDAPIRRPLIAGRDLGEPEVRDELVLQPEAIELPDRPLPAFLVRQAPETVAVEPVPDEAAAPAPAPDAEAEAEADPQPEPQVEPEPQPEPQAEPEPRPEPAVLAAAEAPPPPPAVAVAEAAATPDPVVRKELVEPAPATPQAASGDGDEPSISLLMQRLEFGLGRKERAAPLDPAAIAPPADDAVGHRLRSAINDLQKLAARG